jgi:hypothetical protein
MAGWGRRPKSAMRSALVADYPMRSIFVLVSAPFLHFRAAVVKGQEPMRVQTFGADPPVEGFDEGVVGRLARA